MEEKNMLNIMVIWRGEQLNVDMSPNSKFEELGKKLQKLTSVKPDTMKLLVPQSANKISKLIAPFSDEHSSLNLQDITIVEGKPIRMMGVFDDEIKEVSQNSNKSDLRIAGFDEEEKRLKQLVNGPRASLKLPQGAYIFCDFRTLHIPGIELNPPPSEALRRMHMLACDPGLIAIMNKHRWRVGVLTEMAPVGYVGISPKCILGFNMNKGEEISLRLRTDDLKGFRKYESIKKTLLHELAHMVYSEHDANFFALDKQLNQEAASLDWTKSASHTLSGRKFLNQYEEDTNVEETNYSGLKLGGTWNSLSTARASSVAAAYNRFFNASSDGLDGSQELAEDVYTNRTSEKAHHSLYKEQLPVAAIQSHKNDSELKGGQEKIHAEPDPDDALAIQSDVMHVDVVTDNWKPYSRSSMQKDDEEPDPDDCLDGKRMSKSDLNDSHVEGAMVSRAEPDPDDSQFGEAMKADEPDPDDSISNRVGLNHRKAFEPDPDESGMSGTMMDQTQMERMFLSNRYGESDPGDFAKGVIFEAGNRIESYPDISQATEVAHAEPDPNDHMDDSSVEHGEPDPNDHMDESNNEELQRMEEPVSAICSRLQKAIEMLRSEVTPAEATSALQTLFKIIRNVIEHPDEAKFRRLRKANPHFQRNVANYKAAIDVLTVVGFCEDVILDEVGRAEAYMVLKRNDPGLLWLAKSSIEVSIA